MDINKEKGYAAILDASGKVRLVYSAPVVRLASGNTITPSIEWDDSSSSLYIALPDLAIPFVIAFGLGLKLPEGKGGFHLAFPSFKFGAKGEIEDESSSESEDEDDEKKKSGGFKVKLPKIGGHAKAEVDSDKFKVLILSCYQYCTCA